MKSSRIIQLTAIFFLSPALHAQEITIPVEKTWEIHAQANGGGNPRLAEMTKILLSTVPRSLKLDDNASFHAVGFRNPATPGGDWVAELRGVTNARQLVDEATKHGKLRVEDGAIMLSKGGETCAIWAASDNVIRAVSPVENRNVGFSPAVDPSATSWISGSIPLTDLTGELPKSTILRLLERIDFSVNDQGGKISADVLTASITPEMAAEATVKARKLAAAATLISGEDVNLEVLMKSFTVTQTGDKMHVQITLSQATLEKSLMGIHQFLKASRPE